MTKVHAILIIGVLPWIAGIFIYLTIKGLF